jgi:hypothetical protein
MGDYLRIARAYLSGTAAAVWCFMFLCLLAVAATNVEELARNHGGILVGVLSRKSYLAMFAFFNACLLGVLLRDNIAHPWASVLPHYRKKHLLVATLIALFFLGMPMFSMEFVGTSDIAPTSVAVIFLTCLAAGLWMLHHPVMGFLAFPFLAFAMTPSSSSPELAAFLAGTKSATSAAFAFISLLALWAFAWRLLALNEDMFEYAMARVWGDLLRGRGQAFQGQAKAIDACLAALPAERRAALQNFAWLKNAFSNLKQIDELSGYTERSLWQRLQLWRFGTQPLRHFASVGHLMVITLIMMPLLIRLFPGRDTVVLFSVQVMGHRRLLARGHSVHGNSGGHLGAGTAASQKHTSVHFRHSGGPSLCIRHDGKLAFETKRNGGERRVRILPVHGDGDVDPLDDEQPHGRRAAHRDHVDPGRGEPGSHRAGLPPLVPGGFGLGGVSVRAGRVQPRQGHRGRRHIDGRRYQASRVCRVGDLSGRVLRGPSAPRPAGLRSGRVSG